MRGEKLGNVLFAVLLTFGLFAGTVQCAEADFEVKMESLRGALDLLSAGDRSIVEQTAELIQNGQNTLALARLSTLKNANPENSSVRILTAYALLKAGDLLGAFAEAKKAESAPNGNSYKCWFLAKVALLAGDSAVCQREIEHAKKAGHAVAEVRALEKELDEKAKGKEQKPKGKS